MGSWWFYNYSCCLILTTAILLSTSGGGVFGDETLEIIDDDMTGFNELVDKLNLKFTSAKDFINRLNNYHESLNKVQGFQQKYPGATFALNKFALWTKDELRHFLNYTLKPQNSEDHLRSKRSAIDFTWEDTVPASFDFRDYNKVTPIKDQGQCGACWAFTAIATVESQYLLHFNQTLDLSEQKLVSCDTSWNMGCGGGNPGVSYQYIESTGVPLETCLPYEETDQNAVDCQSCTSPIYHVDGYRYFGTDETQFPTYLYNWGPAAMAFYVPEAFMYYQSGILDAPSTDCNATNNVGGHAVTIIGYTADYWIIKNSWGPYWGENGFVRIKRGVNFCSMTMDVSAPYINTPTTVNPAATTTPLPTTKATTPLITTTGPVQPINCAGAIDLVFVIDGSDTMTATRFATIKSQLASAITQAGIVWGDNNAHVGIVISTGLMVNGATTPYRQVDLSGCEFYANTCTPTVNSTATLISNINNMQFHGGKNNIALSMSETLTGEYDGLPDSWYVFGSPFWGSAGDRPNVPNVMIVISGNDASDVASARSSLSSQNVQIVSIGFSDLPSSQLQAISGNPSLSFTTTGSDLASIITNVCSLTPSPTPSQPATTTLNPTTTPPTTTKATTTMLPTTTKAATTTFNPIITTTINPSTTPSGPVNCAGAIDLVFVVDGSDTMTATRFATIKSQLASAITQSGFVWGDNNAHIGIVISTGLMVNGPTTPYRHLDLSGCQYYADSCTPSVTSTATLIDAINNMQYSGGKNNIALSMNETMTGEYEGLPDSWYVFGSPIWGSAGDRPNAPNVMIVISGVDSSPVAPVTNALLTRGVQIFSIGFSDLSTAQLQAISGNPSKSFSTTGSDLASIINDICISMDAPVSTIAPENPSSSLPCIQGGTWSEWSAATCNDTCGLCGVQVQTRTCLSAAQGCPCTGDTIEYGARCGDAICSFPKAACCSKYGKRAAVGGTIKCIPL